MDEYTFILAAKLEADRRRLEREGAAAAPPATPLQPRRPTARHTPRKELSRVAPFRFLAWR